MNEQISHDGMITSIDGEHIQVRIVQMAACSSCKVAGYCSSAESKEKFVDVWTEDAEHYNIGQKVQVLATSRVGALAVMIGFVLPVILVVLSVVITLWCTCDDGLYPMPSPNDQGLAAIVGLAVLVPYYLAVYAFRSRLQRKLTFTLTSIK